MTATSGPTGEGGPIVVVGAHVEGMFFRIDRLPRAGETILGSDYWEPRDGGKVSNVAVAASRLGGRVSLVTIVGNDVRAAEAMRFFRSEGIDVSWVIQHAGLTDVGVSLLLPNGVPAMVSVPGLSVSLTAEAVRGAAVLLEGAGIVVCALEAPVDGVREALAIGRRSGAFAVLNPSPPEAFEDDLVRVVDLLVMNEHEAAFLAGTDGEPAALAEAVRERTAVPDVVVTAGDRGAVLASPTNGTVQCPAPDGLVPVDTSGAGDSFLGALVASLQRGSDLERALRFAVVAASLSVTRPGTMDSYPRAEELNANVTPER